MIMTSKYAEDQDKFGMDGQYIKLPLSYQYNHNDVLTTGHQDLLPLFVVDEPIEHIVEEDELGNKCEYWLHTVVLYGENKSHHFYPRKFLLPGTIFTKM
jgi:hypothetical protein